MAVQALCALFLLLAAGCGRLAPAPTPTPTMTPAPTARPTPEPPPTATPEPPDTGWQTVRPGVEVRHMRVPVGEPPTPSDALPSGTVERATIVRLDPQAVAFRVHYDPGAPLTVAEWAARLDTPLLVINAGYFTPENETTGLLISDGQRWGAVYGDFAGLFAVSADGQTTIRWLRDRPYDPDEPLTQGVMSFPVLVKPGGMMGFPADADDGRPSRRTVVAQDNEGRILCIVAPRGYLSLHQTAIFLTQSDLGIDVALNLDGGYSSGLYLNHTPKPLVLDSHTDVPSVIEVQPR